MRFSAQRPGRSRRGLTLLEMVVTVALLILIMTIVVQIFQSATGAMSASRAYQELDQGLRRLDSTIRQDLNGVTARLTPPLDPKDNLGYFEYIENAFADAQGEDADDCLSFTAKAPEGQPFTGRVWLPLPANQAIQPTLVTSQYAEVIYFLRNGNLYRRVLLVAPERQSSLGMGAGANGGYSTPMFNGLSVSWQGMNDLSARPSTTFRPATSAPILNTLSDLTNRENRAFHPRFFNDTYGNGLPDDQNRDGIPDYYPTLYPQVFDANPPLINEVPLQVPSRSSNLMPFPYMYQWAYSRTDPATVGSGQGWIHSLDPSGSSFNQAPLEIGDSLPVPTTAGARQTSYGLPTWRETMSTAWTDPVLRSPGNQSLGLQYRDPSADPANDPNNVNFLPPVAGQPFSDNAGSTSFQTTTIPSPIWEDDLIMTGVRSFDIKAYDNMFPGYVDLGWGDDIRVNGGVTPPFLTGTPVDSSAGNTQAPRWTYNGTTYSNDNNRLFHLTYAHEGRIPPLRADFRLDAQSPNPTYGTAAYTPQFPAFAGYTSNVGDDQTSVIRLRRVWDSWSTDYTRAPGSAHNATTYRPTGLPFEPPVYPSYPPPYPMPLRGIQIQIRVVDPRNERIKTLTIRQDFSDKL